MSNPFHTACLVPRDRPNPHKPHTEAFELFELGKYYRQHVKDFEGIHRDGGVYRGTRSGEAFRYNYSTQSIEPVQEVRRERGGRGR
jgi:hypothetical protein